jgi:hypothetical protein
MSPPYGGAEASESAAAFGVPPNVNQDGLVNEVPVLQPRAGTTQPITAAVSSNFVAVPRLRPCATMRMAGRLLA